MKEIILALIGIFIVWASSFALLAGLLFILFWCFGLVFSLRLAFGIWIIIAALIAFCKMVILFREECVMRELRLFVGRKMADD